MTNIEQAKRLKVAGWKQGTAKIVSHMEDGKLLRYYDHVDMPDEKEMMEFLSKQSGVRVTLYGSGVCWYVDVGYENGSHSSSDLTEALVQAVEKVDKMEEGV